MYIYLQNQKNYNTIKQLVIDIICRWALKYKKDNSLHDNNMSRIATIVNFHVSQLTNV